MGIALGMAAAIGWGAADFLARYSTRRVGTIRSLFYMQFVGLVGLTIYIFLAAGPRHILVSASPQAWAWTLFVTLLEIVGALALYRAFEVGILSLVSPIAASFAALTVVLSLLSGEALSGIRAAGVILSLVGVALASIVQVSAAEPAARQSGRLLPPGVGWALGAAACFGVTFWLLGFQVTPRMGSILPVWIVRLLTPLGLLPLAASLRQSLSVPTGSVWWLLASIGILDTAAFLAATAALHLGHVAIVGVLIALYSAVTVMLAWIFLRERLSRLQWLGIGVILLGVALVSS